MTTASTLPPPPQSVTVIGAGLVGIASALCLQAAGRQVTLIDGRAPGTATSYGNAGGIVTGGVVPTSTPGLWRDLPRMLTDPMSPLKIRWAYLPRLAPWLVRFLAAGRPGRVEAISAEIATLTRACLGAHHRLARMAGAEGILRPVGWLKVYRDARAFDGTAYDRGLLDRAGVAYEVLDADALRQLEPGLSRDFTVGLFQPGSSFASTPHALARAWFEEFLRRGGTFAQEEVRRFETGPEGVRAVVTTLAIRPVEAVVIAAGAWSARLAARLGSRIPLETERGYHLNIARTDGGPVLNRPTLVAGPQFVLCPMADGIRLTAGVELAGIEATPDFRRIRALLPLARAALPGLGTEITREWMGWRPSTPDSKPVIGRSPVHRNLVYAFGHGHMGLSFSAITGELVAQILAQAEPAVPLSPFAPDRF